VSAKACVWRQPNSCLCVGNHGVAADTLHLTARQYGEVVLPDPAPTEASGASTGQSPVSSARKLSRCKEGMAYFLPSGYKFYWALRVSRYKFDRSHEFIPGYKFGCGHWRSVGVQAVSEPESCHGTENLIAGRCACPGARTITNLSWGQEQSKKCDNCVSRSFSV